jgi:hypothetical protein
MWITCIHHIDATGGGTRVEGQRSVVLREVAAVCPLGAIASEEKKT